MSDPVIAVIRDTENLSDAMISSWITAQQTQIDRDFLPAWGLRATLVFVPPGQTPPDGAWELWFKDRSDQEGALGYHTDDGMPISYVFVLDALADGVAWTVTASHETLEMIGDPTASRTVVVGNTEFAYENCDAVEDDSFAYSVGGHFLSDFVLPSWFDPQGKAPFSFRHSARAAFELASGGYIGVRTVPGGAWTQRMAMTKGPRQVKRATSRTMRRFNGVSVAANQPAVQPAAQPAP